MNTLPAHLDRSGVEAHVDRLEQLADAVAEYQAAARAPSTRRAYQADVEDWQRWAVRMRCPPWPADGRAVAVYLAAGAKSGLSVATLNRRLSALKAESRDRRLAAPEGPALAEVKDLRKVVGKLPAGLQGVRDRALLLIGFAAALRRSELVALELDVAGAGPVRLAFVGEGAEIRIDRSKADQEGRGAVVAVPFGGELCPVAAVEAWIKAAGLRAGPVFRAIDKGGRVSAEALSDRSVALIVKRACEGAGLNPSGFAGHSLRAGLVTSAAEAGAGLDEIMETSRHAKVETVLKYVRSSKRMKRAVSKRVGL
jgi:site-specific recombinase XerD